MNNQDQIKDLTIKQLKDIRNINKIIKLIKLNDLKNGTYQLTQNLELSKMTKSQMKKEGNFIYGIKKEFPSIEFINYWKSRVGKQPLFLGKWKDPKNNKWIIEIVEFEKDKEQAINKAIKANQFSVWDINKEEELIL